VTPSVPPPQGEPEPFSLQSLGRGRPPGGPDEPPWALWTAPAAIVLGLALGAVASIVVDLAGEAGGSSIAHPAPVVSIISNVALELAFVAAALYFAALHGRPRPEDFGFRRLPLRLALTAFLVAGVAYYVLTALYASLLSLPSEKLPTELGASGGAAALVAATVYVCVIAPMAEETFFRGFIFGVLRRWRITVFGRNSGTLIAAILTGILFGLAHAGSTSPRYLVLLGLLGFVLCLVRWRTRSLYPCMALHSFNNSLALGVDQHWSAGAVLALTVASLLVIAAITGPLSPRRPPRPALDAGGPT